MTLAPSPVRALGPDACRVSFPTRLRRARLFDRMPRMDPHERATRCWYRVAGLVSRKQKDLAVEIIEAEIRSAEYELLLEVSRLVLSGEPIEIARQLRERAERTIRSTGRAT